MGTVIPLNIKPVNKPIAPAQTNTTGRPMPLFTIEEENRIREKIAEYQQAGEVGEARRMISDHWDSFKFVTPSGNDLFTLYRGQDGCTWVTYETYNSVNHTKDIVGDNIDAAMDLMR